MIIDGATGALSAVTDPIDAFGIFPTLITAVADAASLKNVGKPKMFGFKKVNMPNAISVLQDTEVFL